MATVRAKNFKALMKELAEGVGKPPARKPTLAEIEKAGYLDELCDVYKKLGGILEEVPCNIGGFDFSIDGKIVELDEEAHFNRYRAITLSSALYQRNRCFDVRAYIQYCKDYENTCLDRKSGGGFWTNDGAERQFGPPGPRRVLEGPGSPRYKQRALYDYIKDLVPLLFDTPVIRISIYDTFVGHDGRPITVNEILIRMDRRNAPLIYQRIRAVGGTQAP